METVNSVKRRLWAKALYRASEIGFATDCQDLVEHFIEDAVRNLETEDYLTNIDKIAIAESNIERFISEMLLEAKSRGYNELHEDTFYAAKDTLCPLWPFC